MAQSRDRCGSGPEATRATKIERLKRGWRIRLRCGRGQHLRLRIHLERESEAQARADRMVELARLLVRSGKSTEAPVILRKAGEQSTASGFAEVVAFATDLCGATAARDGTRLVTFGDLAERWTSGELARMHPDHVRTKKSTSEDRQRLAKLCPAIGLIPLRDFTLADAKRAMSAIPEGRLPATRRHYAQLISRVLTLAAWPCELIERSPLPRGFLPAVGKSPAFDYLRPSEDVKLLACTDIPFEDRLLYGVLAREGLRAGEARRLRWCHIDLTHGVLRVDVNKSGVPRMWALSDAVTRTLRAIHDKQQPDELIFPNVAVKAAAMFRRQLEYAGIDRPELFERSPQRRPIRVHDLRATFITISLAEGRSEAWIADRTGHTTSAMIQRYRRAARTATELGLGPLKPLDECLPELAEWEGVTRVCQKPGSPLPKVDEFPSDPAVVREPGVEPRCLAALEPKSSASANSATRACAAPA
jgi:integrase